MTQSPQVSRALGRIAAAANDHRWRDCPEFDGLGDFIFDVGAETVPEDEDPKVLAAFADNPDRVAQIRKLAPFLEEAGWHGDVAGAAETLGFTFP